MGRADLDSFPSTAQERLRQWRTALDNNDLELAAQLWREFVAEVEKEMKLMEAAFGLDD